ncbi:type II toxin-antitoxin system Phd/YefM family antitoxin [Enterovibrio norvegicus]|uniref:type II toxin-antitoxin system Phd/YefM family antitoxin n=1 Tax=Enterovibrio norvegicus TaxID=188144 RepID=UPI000C814B29|nr:type II toxin-antitoxin system Phd/YefM family antitoxin [Enterovibrio norvegicus]PMH62413.1 prevent-host-death protein [Enterovibrio norvegicus]
MSTQTISFLKKHAADLPLDEPLIITQNGLPKYVVESFEEYQRRNEAIALMKLITQSKQDKASGRVISSAQLKDGLSKRQSKLKGDNNHEPEQCR